MERRAFGGLSVLFNVSWEKHSPWDIQGSSYPSPGSLLKTNVLDKHQSWTKDFFLKYICLFILFFSALGLRCCARAFSSCGERGLLFVAVSGLLIAVASLAAEHGL